VVIVSHSLGMLKQICTRMVLIEDGTLLSDGVPTKIIEEYTSILKT